MREQCEKAREWSCKTRETSLNICLKCQLTATLYRPYSGVQTLAVTTKFAQLALSVWIARKTASEWPKPHD
jgi:hypothetical protein